MDKNDIRSRLLTEANTILLVGKIDGEMYDRFKTEISYLKTIGSPDCLIEIDSSGGEYFWAKKIASEMFVYKGNITGMATGNCHSCAFYLLQQCDWRIAYSCLDMCMHKIAQGSFIGIRFTEDISDAISFSNKKEQKRVNRAIKSLRKTNKKINIFFESRSNLSFEQINKKMKKDKLYPAERFLEWGFLDEIIDPNKVE